ncbi:MAG: helix-turn-helix domain-containing protein [Candidatus Nomurabacteria bacterium]
MLEKEFSKIGLNNNEREVYLAVLKAGKVSPIRIAKETGINRTTVYSIARKLAKLGLIVEEVGAKAAYLYADKPESLFAIFQKEEDELKEKQDLVKNIVEELKKIPSQASYSVPKIKFIEEDDLTDYLYKQHDIWMESAITRDAIWWGYHDSSVTKTYEDWIHWSWKQPISRDITVNLFSNENKEEEEMNKTHKERHTKLLPTGNEVDSSTWIVGDYTIMVQTRTRPHYLVEICDPVFARNQREFFKCLWNKS